MAELGDALRLERSAYGRGGSNPSWGTKFGGRVAELAYAEYLKYSNLRVQLPPRPPSGFPECVWEGGNWSFDPENPHVIYTPPLGDKNLYNFDFAGWHFHDIGLAADPSSIYQRRGTLLLWGVLYNPEHGCDYLSYHGYSEAPMWSSPEEYEKINGRKFAAAWLIAHWYEHFMHTCPCLVDDGKPTHFRYACIQALLELNP